MEHIIKPGAKAICDRQEDLVTYLYDEATAPERASFEQHLGECAPCRAELNAFGRMRDELSLWQVGFAPRTELVLPRGKMEVLREFVGLFPLWVRGLATTGMAAAVILLALSVAGTRISAKNGDFAISFGQPSAAQTAAGPSQQQIESLVQNAVAAERNKMQQEYQAQFASLKEELNAQHQASLNAVNAAHQAKLEAVKASLQAEIKKSTRQRGSIRSFFAVDDYQQDPWGDVK